jgi:predicted nucleotidyltransferase
MALNPNDPNIASLEIVASRLGQTLREQLVFIGGAVVGLLITDTAMPAIRPTEDVDLIAQVIHRKDYYALESALTGQGFARDLRPAAPICRWVVDRVTVDVMPTLEGVLGFSNSWYVAALETASSLTLPRGTAIRVIAPPAFIATKLEAFAGRGNGDFLFSHDLGDVISVIDGRDELALEIAAAPTAVRLFLAQRFSELLCNGAFIDSLPGHLPGDAASQERLPDLIAKLHAIAR